MRNILKQWSYPKGLQTFIFNETTYRQLNPYRKSNSYVNYYQMVDGHPMQRIFAFKPGNHKHLKKDMLCREVARFYKGKMYIGYVENQYLSGLKIVFWDDYANWKDRFWPVDSQWTFPAIKMNSEEEFLVEHNLQYTGWEEYEGDLNFCEYIDRWLENPKVELLTRAGLGKWVKYMRYLDTSKKSLAGIFKIKPNCTDLLYRVDFGFSDLMVCRKTGSNSIDYIKAKVALDRMKRDLKGHYRQMVVQHSEIYDILCRDETAKYCSKFKTGWWVNDYLDYLKDLYKLGALNDPRMLYPEDLQVAHARTSKQVQIQEDQIIEEGFRKQYAEFLKYALEDGNYLIRPVQHPYELREESKQLVHCVRTYIPNVAEGITEIMFIRKKDEPEVPFYTLELKSGKVIQVRGEHNRQPSEEVDAFVEMWAKKFRFRRQKMLY